MFTVAIATNLADLVSGANYFLRAATKCYTAGYGHAEMYSLKPNFTKHVMHMKNEDSTGRLFKSLDAVKAENDSVSTIQEQKARWSSTLKIGCIWPMFLKILISAFYKSDFLTKTDLNYSIPLYMRSSFSIIYVSASFFIGCNQIYY